MDPGRASSIFRTRGSLRDGSKIEIRVCVSIRCGVRFGSKKIPVVPVSYREKIRVGRSEINFFLNLFSWFWRFFAGRFAVESQHQY
jgi:hypothetical protein